MTLRLYSIILLIIFASSISSALLLFYYMNPEGDFSLAFSLMAFSVILAGGSIFAFVLFFIKKIYYRGEVYVATMNASLRQATLIMIGTIGTLGLSIYGISQPKLVLIIWMVMMVIEVMAQALE